MKRPAIQEHQLRVVNFGRKNPYSILAADPGLGKSRCGIEIREELKNNCLIICPSYLISNWEKEIKKWADNPNITLFKKGKDIYETCDTDYIVTSYDLVQKAEWLFEWADMVILDEAHAIKSMKAKRSQFIHKNIYENSVPRVHLLTGTPIKNRVQEFYSLLALCHYNPSVADTTFLDAYPSEIDFAEQFSYKEEYTMEVGNRWFTVVKWHGIKNEDQLKVHLKNKYIRIDGSVLNLPPVIYKEFQVSDVDDKELLRAFNWHFAEDDDERPAREKERKERTASVLPEHKAMAALKKVPFTIKYATDLLEEVESLLIYTDHVKPAEEIAKAFGVVPITGHVPSAKRSEMADAFQRGEGKLMVATIGSMKEGKDLYRANHMIFNDFPWVPGDLKQVIHRIQRLGQKSTCTVHKIIGSPQDKEIISILEEKLDTINRAI